MCIRDRPRAAPRRARAAPWARGPVSPPPPRWPPRRRGKTPRVARVRPASPRASRCWPTHHGRRRWMGRPCLHTVFTSRAKMPARQVAGAQSLKLPAKQKTMRSELGAVRDPGHGQVRDPRLAPAGPAPHWDAQVGATTRLLSGDCALTSRRSSHFRGLVGEPLRVFSRRNASLVRLAACKTLGIPKPLAL